MTRLCLVGVGCLVFLTSCDKALDYSPDPPAPDPAEQAYPVDRLIMDKKGRAIDVSITGKGPNSIRFLRKSDGKHYEYLIEDLSVKDQAFVDTLPRNRLHKMVKPTPPYVLTREKEMKELREKIVRLRNKANTTVSKVEKRTLNSEVDRLMPRMEKLRDQIEDFQRQNPDH